MRARTGCNAAMTVTVWLLLPLLPACGGVHLYDAARHKVAEQAKTSYEAARLLEVVEVERANLRGLLDAELETAGRYSRLLLQLEWFRMVDTDQSLRQAYHVKGIGKRLMDMGVVDRADAEPDAALMVDLVVLDRELRDVEAAVRREAKAIQLRFGVEPPPCEPGTPLDETQLPSKLKEAAKDRLATASELYKEYVGACARLQEFPVTARKERIDKLAAPDKVLGIAYGDWLTADTALRRAQRDAAAAQARLDEVLRHYDEAVKDLPRAARDAPARGPLAEQIDRLRQALAALEGAGGALGADLASDERARRINRLLEAAASGKLDDAQLEDPELGKAAAVAAGLPSISEDVLRLLTDRRARRMSVFLIEKQRQELRRDAAARRVERMARRVQLRRQKLDAVLLELRHLHAARLANRRADAEAGRASGPDPQAGTLRAFLAGQGAPAVRRHLYQGLLAYVDSYASARARQEELELRLVALDHEEAVDSTQVAIGLWNALIATPINQLVAYHGAGIKAEEVAALVVQLVTLGSIGVGVNR